MANINLPPYHKRPAGILIALIGMTPIVFVLALSLGSVPVSLDDWLAMLPGAGEKTGAARDILVNLRLPRTLSALITGSLLALAGVLMQVLLRNPLADPYILGISGGAAVAAMLAMLAGVGGLLLTGSAILGALLSMVLVFALAHGSGSWTPTRLLLTGVVIASGWGAIIGFILSISPQQNLHGMLFWLMGDLSYAPSPAAGLAVMLFGLMAALTLAKPLNVLARGDMTAQSLGVNVTRLRLQIYVLASLFTATAVTVAGSVGFIGLITPHLLRLMGVSDHRFLLPASALLGACILVVADTVSRTAIAPQQLPVGVVTAFVGVPLFLYLLQKSSRTL
jgi:iron complex transport system permease protein